MSLLLFYNCQVWRDCGKLYDWFVVDQKSGKVVDCGNNEPSDAEVINKVDMKQQWIFPGFHDSHLHVGYTGMYINKNYNLNLPRSFEEFKQRLKLLISSLPSDQGWFVGYNWDHSLMGQMPTIEDIDKIVSDRPVVLFRTCLHICLVNSVAFSKLNISSLDLASDHLGKYEIGHPKAGQPNGLFLEDKGVKIVLAMIPETSSDHKKKNVLIVLNRCLQEGLTSVHTCEDSYWNEYVELAKSSQLPIHCYYSPFPDNFGSANCPSKPEKILENLSCDIVKVFIDGALGSSTAAISVPYLQKNSEGGDNYGILQKTKEDFKNLFSKINDAGFRLEIHVIGDKAAELALDLLESCQISPETRPIFVHCQILREDLLSRMVNRGVVPTIQPSFVPTDAKWIHESLPPELMKCIYPWKTLLRKGLVCGGSSDSPVETTNPLQGIYDAIYRPSPDGTPFLESECLTFKEAVSLYTTGSAFADFAESYKGKLEIGFQADFVVLDVPSLADGTPHNLPQNPKLLKETTVKEVWIKGKKVWQK